MWNILKKKLIIIINKSIKRSGKSRNDSSLEFREFYKLYKIRNDYFYNIIFKAYVFNIIYY
jgi:hypothetical protein